MISETTQRLEIAAGKFNALITPEKSLSEARQLALETAISHVKQLVQIGSAALKYKGKHGKRGLNEFAKANALSLPSILSAMKVARMKVDYTNKDSVCEALRLARADNAVQTSDFIQGRLPASR